MKYAWILSLTIILLDVIRELLLLSNQFWILNNQENHQKLKHFFGKRMMQISFSILYIRPSLFRGQFDCLWNNKCIEISTFIKKDLYLFSLEIFKLPVIFSRFLGIKVASWLLKSFSKLTNFKWIFQHLSLTYCIPLVKDQSNFHETCSLAVYINIKGFNRVNRKQLNILKTNYIPRASCL